MAAEERWELSRMSAAEAVLCGGQIVSAASGATSLEDAAGIITARLRDTLWDSDQDRPALVLSRFYRTVDFGALAPDLREFAQAASGGAEELSTSTKCLTLMGTAGDEPAWNSRFESRGHRAIPLTSVPAVQRLPMVAQLIQDLGMSVEGAVKGRWAPQDMSRLDRVFYVRQAAGSEAVPAQDFVGQHGVRSVLGFGGPLQSGDLWAVILFSRVSVSPDVAGLFRLIATDVRIGLLPVLTRRLFAA